MDSIVFSGTAGLVRDVMVGGRWVVKDGEHSLQGEVVQSFREANALIFND